MVIQSGIRKLSVVISAVLVIALTGLGALFPQAAQADDNADVRIYDVKLQRLVKGGSPPKCDDVPLSYPGAQTCVHWKWDASQANPKAGDSFYLGLPERVLLTDTVPYDLVAELDGKPDVKQKIGQCVPTRGDNKWSGRVTCTFDDGLTQAQNEGNSNFRGTGWLIIRPHYVEGRDKLEFDLNGTRTPIDGPGGQPIPAPTPPGGSHPPYSPIQPQKYADSIYSDSKLVTWNILFSTEALAAKLGAEVPVPMVLMDTISEAHTFPADEAVDIRIIKTKTNPNPGKTIRVGTTHPNKKALVNHEGQNLIDITREIINDRTMKITLTPQNGKWDPDTFYSIVYYTKPVSDTGLIDPGKVYYNTVEWEGYGFSKPNQSSYVTQAGGTAMMDPAFGNFSLAKLIDGPDVNAVPAGTKVVVKAEWKLPDGKQPGDFPGWTAPANPLLMELPIGMAVTSDRFPTGTTITLSENPAPADAVVQWANPRFKVGDGAQTPNTAQFTIEGATTIGVELTNEARVKKPKVRVGDYVFEDVNKDGLQDAGDKPIQGAVLYLKDANGNYVMDGANKRQAVTGPDGKYLFEDLPALESEDQSYTVEFGSLPDSHRLYVPTQSVNQDDRRDEDSSEGQASSYKDLTSDKAEDLSLDFGFIPTTPGIDIEKYTGTWNGITFVGDEPRLVLGQPEIKPDGDHDTPAEALVVKPDDTTDLTFTVTNTGTVKLHHLIVSDTTNAGPDITGFYCTINGQRIDAVNGEVIPPADYVLAPRETFTCQATVPALNDEPVHTNTTRVQGVPVAGGEPVADRDPFNVKRPPSVSVGDFVFEDVNKDGLQDADDKPIEGAVLYLKDANGNYVMDGTEKLQAVTGPDGKYMFEDLPTLADAGQTYTVEFHKLPAGYELYIPTYEGVGSDRAIDSSTGTAQTTIPMDVDKAEDLTLDFGFIRTQPGIDIEKYVGEWDGVTFTGDTADLDGNQPKVLPIGDHDTPADALVLAPGQSTQVKFTVTNTGTAELTKVTVTDATSVGPALTNMVCGFPAAGQPAAEVHAVNGVVTAPDGFILPPKGVIECTATLPALDGSLTHVNDATVEATPVAGGQPVKDTDPFNAKRPKLVSVGDYVFEDVNKDGIQDAGDKPIEGAVLRIEGPDGTVLTDGAGKPREAITNAAGLYMFENLPALTKDDATGEFEKYTVVFHKLPAEYEGVYVPTKAGVGSDREVDSSTAKAPTTKAMTEDGERDLSLDFGFIKPTVSVGDFVWVDEDKNGLQDDGEPGIEGVVLNVYAPGGKIVMGPDGVTPREAITDASGKYLFDNLPALEEDPRPVQESGLRYVVKIDKVKSAKVLEKYIPTTEGPNNGEGELDSSTDLSASVVPLSQDGAKDLSLDFGFRTKPVPLPEPEPKVSVGDYVFEDVNKDGIQDAGDKPIEGAVLQIKGPDGNLLVGADGSPLEATTDASGLYMFDNLPALTKDDAAGEFEKYTVVFHKLPAAYEGKYIPTDPGVGGDPERDSSTGEASSTKPLTENGDQDLSLDFGFRTKPVPLPEPEPKVSVGDYVFEDVNKDGIQDAGDKPIEGAVLQIKGPDGSLMVGADGSPLEATTDASGLYMFEKLPALTKNDATGEFEKYTVVLVRLPDAYSAYTPTEAGVGGDREIDSSTGEASTIKPLTENGDKDLSLDFGFKAPEPQPAPGKVSVGDKVWHDTNKNGLQDPGEPGLKGVQLTIYGPDGKPVLGADNKPRTTTTDKDGMYTFDELPALKSGQKYVVKVDNQQAALKGYTPTKAGVGPDRGRDSSTGMASTVMNLILDGDKDLTLDFGFIKSPVPPKKGVPKMPVTGATTGVLVLAAIALAGAGVGALRRKRH